jgi:hypothetical protein
MNPDKTESIIGTETRQRAELPINEINQHRRGQSSD